METIVQEKGLAFSLGAADYLTKPIQWQRLKKVLHRFRSDTPPARALVVDDDSSTRDLLLDLLKQEGWSVVEAQNREAVFERIAESRPALILVDLHMSSLNGVSLIQELHRLPELGDVPVIAVSEGDLTPEERIRVEGRVQQIIDTQHDAADALLAVLRKVPSSHRIERRSPNAARSEEAHGKDTAG